MYNRYIPQNDGTFRRTPMRENVPQQPHTPPREPPREPPKASPSPRPAPKKEPQRAQESFLRRLLPPDFDTGDLMVVLLLLLMAGDSPEEQSNAMLTLALYLFL